MEMALVGLLRPGIASARTLPVLTTLPACGSTMSEDPAAAGSALGPLEYAVFQVCPASAREGNISVSETVGAPAKLSAVLETALVVPLSLGISLAMTSYVSAGDLGPSGMPPELSAAVAMASVGSLARTSEGPAVAVPPWEPLEYAFSQSSLASASDSRPSGATEGIAIMEMALVGLLRPGIASARTLPVLTTLPACGSTMSEDPAAAGSALGPLEYAVFQVCPASAREGNISVSETVGAPARLSAVLETALVVPLSLGISLAMTSYVSAG